MLQFKEIFSLPFISSLQDNGGKAYIVGGAVRDHFQGLNPKDIDIVVCGIPATELQNILSKHGKVDLVGESFGVFKLVQGNVDFDISLPRVDKKIQGAKGHKSIEAQSDHLLPIEADLGRRDFTINAIAIDKDMNVIDPFGGQEDLYKGIIGCVSADTFVEDPLRMMRALQFAARFNFEIDDVTFELIADNRLFIKEEVPERILMEFQKVFSKNGNVAYFAELLHRTGLFSTYFDYNIKYGRLGPAQHLAELLYFGIADGEMLVADYYKKKLGSALPLDLYKDLKAFDTVYHSKLVGSYEEQMKITYQSIFDAIKQSEIVLGSNFIKDTSTMPFITGEFPKTRKQMAITGDDLTELGFKQGNTIGLILQECLDNIFSRKLKNDKVELLTIVKKYQNA